MKKLITAIAAIATSFGLFATDFEHSVTNDISFKTNNLVVGYDAMGATQLSGEGTAMIVNWFADSLKTNFHTNIEGYEQPELKDSDTNPSYKYLAIDTDVKDPVLRTFSAVAKDDGADNYKYDQVGITDHGVFIDTWTTFTLFDTDPEAPSDSKILVWAKETEADADAGIEGATNLMVTCGTIDPDSGKTVSTNYVLNIDSVLPNGLQPETMYRLTIRADKDTENETTKFRVYLNGEQLETVAHLKDFPSIIEGTQNQQLGSAGFGGTGSLKSVDLLTAADAEDKVDFAADDTYLAVSWNYGVTGFTVEQIGRDPQVIVVTGSGTTNLLVHSGDATVTPTYLTNPKYKFDSFAKSGTLKLKGATDGIATIEIQRYAGHNGQDVGTLAINAVEDRKGASLLIEHGDKTQEDKGVMPHLDDVMAYIWKHNAKNPMDIKPGELGVDDTLYITLVNDEVSTNFNFAAHDGGLTMIWSSIVLDLNGHSMSNTVDTECLNVIDNDTLFTIRDTSETGGGMIVAQEGQNLIVNNYDLTIDVATQGADIKFKGKLVNTSDLAEKLTINGGKFSDISTLDPDKDPLVILPEGKKWSATPVDGYYSLVDAGAKTVTITTNPAIGVFGVWTNDVPVVLSGNTATIGELDPFKVTFSKAAHYNLDDTTGWTLTDNVYSKDFGADVTAVTLPTGTAITFDVTFADGAHSTITPAAGTSNLVEGTVVAVTATAAENYEFAAAEYTGWTKEQDGTLTKSYTVTAVDTVTAPNATAKPVDVTLPQELPTGVASLVVSQKVNEAWVDVTATKKIDVGNEYVVVAIPAAGYTIDNPIKNGTAAVGVNISVTKEDVEAKIGKQTFTVTVPDLVNFTVAVTNDETEVGTTNGVYTFDYATNVKVAFTAVTGYEIKTDTSTNIASLVENVVIAAPTVVLKTFTVTFKVEGQTDIVSNDVAYGTAFANVKPADPVVTGKNFTGWTPVVDTIDGTELVFTAQFEVQKFTVTFLNEDDSEYAVSNDVPYNTAFDAVKPADPTKADYTFAGWIPAGEPVISNSTYKATFTLNTYAITWTSENVVATNNGAQVESGITLAKDAMITFYPTVGLITNIVVDGVAVDPVSPYTFTVKAQVSVLKVLAGETAAPSPIPPAQGTVEYSGSGESAVAKIKPNPNVTQIDVNPTIGYMGKYEIPSSVTKITGVAINQLIIKTGEYDIAPACKLVNGGEIVLDDTKTVSEVPVKPTIGSGVAATDVKPADGAIAVKGIAGLYYALVRGDDPATVGTAGTVKDAKMATGTGANVSLADATTKGAKGFYVIKVSIEEPAIVEE